MSLKMTRATSCQTSPELALPPTIRRVASSPTSSGIDIFAQGFDDEAALPDDPSAVSAKMTIDAIAEPDDLPDFAVQPGVVDFAGLDNTADYANISGDDGGLYVVDMDIVEDTSVSTHPFGSPWGLQINHTHRLRQAGGSSTLGRRLRQQLVGITGLRAIARLRRELPSMDLDGNVELGRLPSLAAELDRFLIAPGGDGDLAKCASSADADNAYAILVELDVFRWHRRPMEDHPH